MTVRDTSIVEKNYQGLAVQFTGEGWFNATKAAERFEKEPFDWLNQRDTVEYVCALSEHMSISGFLKEFREIKELDGKKASSKAKLLRLCKKTGLVKTKQGGYENGGGTWLHPKLGIAFARWLDVHFAVWCDQQIDSLIRGEIDVKRARHKAASLFKVQCEMLRMTRESAGKPTEKHHYINEARLINWVLTGHFTALDRDSLSEPELDLLARLEERNACLIGMGLSYQLRKQALTEYLPSRQVCFSTTKELT
jgi:hypothetical protein